MQVRSESSAKKSVSHGIGSNNTQFVVLIRAEHRRSHVFCAIISLRKVD